MLISKVVCSFYKILFTQSSFLQKELFFHSSCSPTPPPNDKAKQFFVWLNFFHLKFRMSGFDLDLATHVSHNQMTTLFIGSVMIKWSPYLQLISHVLYEPFCKMRYATFLLSSLLLEVPFTREWVLLNSYFLILVLLKSLQGHSLILLSTQAHSMIIKLFDALIWKQKQTAFDIMQYF